MSASSHQVPAVIPSLGRWGLSAYADLVYRTLLMLGPATGAQLARHLGADGPRTGRALDELVAVGAVHRLCAGRERRWRAVDAAHVLTLVRRRRAPLTVDEHCRQHLAAVAGVHLDRLPAAGVRRLPTRAAARHRISALVAAERHEHLAINTEDVISADARAAAAPLDHSLLARGLRLRVLGLRPRDGGSTPVPAGGEYREAPTLPLKLIVFDRRSALLPADPANFDAGALEIIDRDAVTDLVRLFHQTWRTAQDPNRQEVPPIVLTVREQAILALLTAGHSEEAAATELGLSRRTVVYALRALMDRLGVENRWQLALVLGAAHAVPLPAVTRTDDPQEP